MEDCIQNRIDDLLQSQQHFIQANRVQPGFGVVIIVDSDNAVRQSFKQKFYVQTKQFLLNTTRKMLLKIPTGETRNALRKLTIPRICIVEADSGEEVLTTV